MKKQLSLIVGLVGLWAMPSVAATNSGMRAASSADLTGAPATRARERVNYEKYETRTTTQTYSAKDGGNMYYTQPSNRSALYKNYDNARGGAKTTQRQMVRTTRAETVRSELKRKYYLAHPFFQPLKGKFGSVTDVAYTMNSYDMAFTPIEGMTISDTSAKWDMKQFSVKEDFSYGITDKIAVMGMLKYDWSDYKFDWSVAPDDKMDDNGLNLFGLGAQWRVMDNDKWIATVSAYFQHQKDIADNYILDLKAGYKVASSTIYGLARGWLVDFDGTSYGNGIEGVDENGQKAAIFLAYKTDVDTSVYGEFGLGVFSVLDEDWTLNLEAVFGSYDWHNQASIKGAIGWQPGDMFALNLYAKTAFYDSADDKNLSYWWIDSSMTGWQQRGSAKIDNYAETTVGLQAILYF